MSETSRKIMEEIHERKIVKRPRWHFLLKNASVWVFFGAAVFLSALAISMEEAILERGIGAYGIGTAEFFGVMFQGISFLWIACTVLFIVFAFLNLRLTTEGYRYRTAWIVLGIVLVIATMALLFRHEGVGDRAESIVEHSHLHHIIFQRDAY
ncbi:MAG: hypothetical protein KGI60_02560 [Patescibacteria group bacterium]|nr:hypothetical protein [Patescibacteria group bacterium]